jgi:hypothetical protein
VRNHQSSRISESRPSRPRLSPGGLVIPVRIGIRGEAHWRVYDERGVPEVPRSPSGVALGPVEGVRQSNLVTNHGLDALADSNNSVLFIAFGNSSQEALNWRRRMALGTGSTTPHVDDTELDNEVQRVSSAGVFDPIPDGNNGIGELDTSGSPHYWRWRGRIVRAATMSADRNLTEFGLAHATTADIRIRELFRDELGDPVTISLLTGKILRLDHTVHLECEAPEAGFSDDIDIEEYDAGNNLVDTIPVSITHGGWVSSVTDANVRRLFGQIILNEVSGVTRNGVRITSSAAYARIGTPAFSSSFAGAFEAYTPGTYTRIWRATQDAASDAAAWHGFSSSNSGGGWIVRFADPYTKADTDTLRIGFITEVGRA